MKRLFVTLCAVLALCTLPANAAYTAASVKGSYSFLLNEWTATSGSNSAWLGVMTFDGVSAVSGEFVQVTLSGTTSFTIESGSTYSVKSAGTGSISLVTSSGTLPFIFVLTAVSSNVAQQLQLLSTDPSDQNIVVEGTALAINLSGSGSNANLKGTYTSLEADWNADSTIAIAGSVGTLKFDGVSKVTATFTEVKEGVSQTLTGSGTYSVNTDGSGSMTLTVSGNTVSKDFVINDVVKSVAKGLQHVTVIPSTGGTVVATGSAIFQ